MYTTHDTFPELLFLGVTLTDNYVNTKKVTSCVNKC